MIFLIGSQKGGVGKTTLAFNMAAWLSSKGNEVLLVDADEQASASMVTEYRQITIENVGYTFVSLKGAHLRKQIEALKSKYDYIVIDAGGRDSTSLRAALFVCDVFIAPFAPRSLDLWTIVELSNIVEEIQAGRQQPFHSYSLINKADTTNADNREAAELLEQYPQLTYIPHPIKNRKAFANSISKGLAVYEMPVPDKKAVAEIETLFNFLLDNGNNSTPANK